MMISLLLALTACKSECDPGEICTWFGTPQAAGLAEEGTPRDEAATFWSVDVAFHPTEGFPVIMDWNNHRLVTIDADDKVHTLTGVGGELGDGPEGNAASALWNHPTDMTWTSDGSPILAAWHNSRVVRFDADFSTAEFIAGTGGRDFAGDGGPAKDAVLDLPCGVVVDEDDNIYVADMANQRIRRIDPDGIITTAAAVQRRCVLLVAEAAEDHGEVVASHGGSADRAHEQQQQEALHGRAPTCRLSQPRMLEGWAPVKTSPPASKANPDDGRTVADSPAT